MKIEITKDKAIAFAKTNHWKSWDHEKLFLFQISQEKICTDFSKFHEATEKVLGRPVFNIEFADLQRLYNEYIDKTIGGN